MGRWCISEYYTSEASQWGTNQIDLNCKIGSLNQSLLLGKNIFDLRQCKT